jgi:hypothetical protein
MFHFIVPENKIMICCFKKRYVSKLCFRKSKEISLPFLASLYLFSNLKGKCSKSIVPGNEIPWVLVYYVKINM